jgi:hypothetical protein
MRYREDTKLSELLKKFLQNDGRYVYAMIEISSLSKLNLPEINK